MAIRSCTVSILDPHGITHSVDVTAETLYEAAASGLVALKRSGWSEPVGPSTRIEVQVREPVTVHTLTLAQIRRWCEGVAPTPDDVLRKNRVKALIG